MENSSSNETVTVKRQSKVMTIECKICGGPAKYSYYGAISCYPCKTFFKRHAERKQNTLKCDIDGQCEINLNNRHICSYCRFQKCLTSGMQTGMIRAPLPETSKKRKMIKNEIQTTSTPLIQSEQFRTLNLLRSDQSTLTAEHWNLISNISHCYDEHSGLSRSERYMSEQNNLPHKLRFKSSSLIEFIQTTLHGVQLLYKRNQDFLSLSTNDRLALLHRTLKYTAGLSSNFIWHQVGLLNYGTYYDAIETITHPSVADASKRMNSRLDFDFIVMKLLLAILSFSTIGYTCYSNQSPLNLSNIKQILDIQGTYTELTWRYLLYKYNHEQAVICFSNFLRCLFALNEAIMKADDVQWYTDRMNALAEQTKQTLILHD